MPTSTLHWSCGFTLHSVNWEEAQKLIVEGDKERGLAPRQLCEQLDSDGRTALHLAARAALEPNQHPPAGFIGSLTDTYPGACRQKDKHGRLPIHFALIPPDQHELRSRVAPHLACDEERAKVDAASEVIDALLRTYPEGFMTEDRDGKLPLEIALQHQADIETVKCLVGAIAKPDLAAIFKTLGSHSSADTQIPTGLDMVVKQAGPDGNYDGRTVRDILQGTHKGERYRMLAKTIGAYLERYQRDKLPVHKTTTSRVWYATDAKKQDRKVCIKILREREQFLAEIHSRYDRSGRLLEGDAFVSILGWHTPPAETYMFGSPTNGQQAEHVRPFRCSESRILRFRHPLSFS
eukprot:COSAG02_NODE_3412_length_6785_cov_30.460664_6_plen_350_part_00